MKRPMDIITFTLVLGMLGGFILLVLGIAAVIIGLTMRKPKAKQPKEKSWTIECFGDCGAKQTIRPYQQVKVFCDQCTATYEFEQAEIRSSKASHSVAHSPVKAGNCFDDILDSEVIGDE
jgi:ribosomal protein S27E